jgi:SAM-dependent methyltransferase
MLVDPMLVAPVPANGRRIVAQHMDARDLRYEDGTFDGVFSASSLEHFGTDEDIVASVAEMYRVLKPGGVLAISTEFKIAGPGTGNPGLRYFPAEDLRTLVIESRPWIELDELDFGLSEATLAAPTSFEEAMAVLQQGSDRWPTYPHIVISDGRGYSWTSVSLALRKPG